MGRLSVQVMSLVRSTLETPDNGLNREQFALSLRLVAAAQASLVLSMLKQVTGPASRHVQTHDRCIVTGTLGELSIAI